MATTVTIYRLCVDGDMENRPSSITCWLYILQSVSFCLCLYVSGLERYQEIYPIPNIFWVLSIPILISVWIIGVLLYGSTASDQLDVTCNAWSLEGITATIKPHLVICHLPCLSIAQGYSFTLPSSQYLCRHLLATATPLASGCLSSIGYWVGQWIETSPSLQYWQLLGVTQWPNTSVILTLNYVSVHVCVCSSWMMVWRLVIMTWWVYAPRWVIMASWPSILRWESMWRLMRSLDSVIWRPVLTCCQLITLM